MSAHSSTANDDDASEQKQAHPFASEVETVASALKLFTSITSRPMLLGVSPKAFQVTLPQVRDVLVEAEQFSSKSHEVREYLTDALGKTVTLDRFLGRLAEEQFQVRRADESKVQAVGNALNSQLGALDRAISRLEEAIHRQGVADRLEGELESVEAGLGQLQTQFRSDAAATGAGIDLDSLDYTQHANLELLRANTWRRLAFGLLLATVGLAMYFAFDAIDRAAEWSEIVLRLSATLSLVAASGYAMRQSSEHREESRSARRNALDLVTIGLFVQGLEPSSKDAVLHGYGMRRFAQTPATDSSTKAEPQSDAADSVIKAIAKRLGG